MFLLEVEGSDEVPGPMPLSYTWSVVPSDAGRLVSLSGPSTVFRCSRPGRAVVTVDVSDADCGDKMDVMVECAAPAP